MKSGQNIWTERLITEIDKSVRTVIARKFPRLSIADREDVRQEVQVKIWRMMTSGKKIDRLESYLWRVVTTTTLAIMGDRFREVSLDDLVGGWNGRLPAGLTVHPDITEAENRELLATLVERLPQKRRLVVKYHLAGLSLEETAAHLSWTLPKVRHLFYRSIKRLQLISASPENTSNKSRKSKKNGRFQEDFVLPKSGDSGEVVPE